MPLPLADELLVKSHLVEHASRIGPANFILREGSRKSAPRPERDQDQENDAAAREKQGGACKKTHGRNPKTLTHKVPILT